MLPFFDSAFGNPSTIYTIGQEAREAIEHAREQVARLVNADADDVYFTSGDTESDNWAIKGVARAWRDRLIEGILEAVPDAVLTGHPMNRLPNNAHLAFAGVEGESLVLSLDAAGIYCSAGAACSSGDTEPSHVLVAMGIDPHLVEGSVRFTLGKDNTSEQIEYTIEQVARAVNKLRSLRVRG